MRSDLGSLGTEVETLREKLASCDGQRSRTHQ